MVLIRLSAHIPEGASALQINANVYVFRISRIEAHLLDQ